MQPPVSCTNTCACLVTPPAVPRRRHCTTLPPTPASAHLLAFPSLLGLCMHCSSPQQQPRPLRRVPARELSPTAAMASLVVSFEEVLAGKLGKEEAERCRKWRDAGGPLYSRPGNLVVTDDEGVDMRVSAVGWIKRRKRTSGGHLLPGVPPRQGPGDCTLLCRRRHRRADFSAAAGD